MKIERENLELLRKSLIFYLDKKGSGALSDLASKTGYSQGSLSGFKLGKKGISAKAMDKIAMALGTTLGDMIVLGQELKENETNFSMRLAAVKRIQSRSDVTEIPTRTIPVFDGGAGEPSNFENGGFPVGKSFAYESVPARDTDPNTFGVRIHGYSMAPRLMPDDIVIVVPSAQLEPGQICFAALPDGRRLVKRYFSQGNGVIILRSDNPDKKEFPDMHLTTDENKDARIYRVKRRIEEL